MTAKDSEYPNGLGYIYIAESGIDGTREQIGHSA